MKYFAAFLNLVVAATLRGRWEEESWLQAYTMDLPGLSGFSEAEEQERWWLGE